MIGIGISVWQAILGGTSGAALGPDSPAASIILSNDAVAESASVGALVGNLSVVNGTGTYTFTLTNDAAGQFAVDVARLEVNGTLNYEAVTSYAITAHADNGAGSVLDRDFTVTVTNVLEVTLAALTLDNSDLDEESAAGTLVGAIQNASSGSTITLTDNAGGRFALSGSNVIAGLVATDYETATSHNITLRETHADGNNSPRDSVIAITINDVAEGGGPSVALKADLSDPNANEAWVFW